VVEQRPVRWRKKNPHQVGSPPFRYYRHLQIRNAVDSYADFFSTTMSMFCVWSEPQIRSTIPTAMVATIGVVVSLWSAEKMIS
jgi:hypothetical protein